MTFVWIVFATVAVFSLSISNLTVCLVGIILTLTNTWGFIRCDKNHSNKISDTITSLSTKDILGSSAISTSEDIKIKSDSINKSN